MVTRLIALEESQPIKDASDIYSQMRRTAAVLALQSIKAVTLGESPYRYNEEMCSGAECGRAER